MKFLSNFWRYITHDPASEELAETRALYVGLWELKERETAREGKVKVLSDWVAELDLKVRGSPNFKESIELDIEKLRKEIRSCTPQYIFNDFRKEMEDMAKKKGGKKKGTRKGC